MKNGISIIFIVGLLPLIFYSIVLSQEDSTLQMLDNKVKSFLERYEDEWDDMNIPEIDGKILYDLIVKNNFKHALEIGTSTGHSGIWIAWALSKTGGKLITIEIDEDRYKKSLANFEKAGLSKFIDARLADAHELVKEIDGPFDFVFCDADKGWYKNYFVDIYPKLQVGGCYTVHNISESFLANLIGHSSAEYYDYVKSLPNMKTTLNDSGNGISISYKKSEK